MNQVLPPGVARGRATHALAIGAITSGIAIVHAFTPDELIELHYVLQRLFYFPVVYAGIYFGWKGGLAAAGCAALAYLPQIVAASRIHPRYSINQYTEVAFFCVVGVVTGLIVARTSRQKKALEKTAAELSRVYGELQDNFEQMKRAERLYALGQISAGLAHEIRNPLAGIEGAASVLLREPPSEERRVEFLRIIQRECRRLNRLLTHFLTFVRPSAPRYETVPLDQLFDSVISLSEHVACNDKKRVSLRSELPADLPLLKCDPEQIKQVLLNLILNAIQATLDQGEVVLSARRHARSLAIEVRDQGIGVSESHMERMFDPFFTTKETGTGLGLSIAHQIAVTHKGGLTARRNPESGMTFTLELPLTHVTHGRMQ